MKSEAALQPLPAMLLCVHVKEAFVLPFPARALSLRSFIDGVFIELESE